MDKIEKQKNIYKILCIILLIILIVVLVMWGHSTLVEKSAAKTYEKLQESVNSDASDTKTQASETAQQSTQVSENAGDTTLVCISVSPRMMEEILEKGIQEKDTIGITEIISKLKSMQIVYAEKRGKGYFEKAEEMAERNSARFRKLASYDKEKDHCRIFVREQEEQIVELVLLKQEGRRFTVINFTGNMDRGFIEELKHTMILKPMKGEES